MVRSKRGSAYASWTMAPSPLVNTEPAIPSVLRILISRNRLPRATREYNSPVWSSFRNSVPRSASVSFALISTMVLSSSSRVSMTATCLATRSNSSISWNCFLSLTEIFLLPAIGLLQLRAQNRDHLLELRMFVPRAALQLLAQSQDCRFELGDLVISRGGRLLNAFLFFEIYLLHLFAHGDHCSFQ